jgi:hypothetical protein
MSKAPHHIYFTKVAATENTLFFAGNLPAVPDILATRIAKLTNQDWESVADLPEIVASFDIENFGVGDTLCAMLRNGVTHFWTGEQHWVETIDEDRGLFFGEMRSIGGILFACGAGHQVFRKSDGSWQPIDEQILIDPAIGRDQAKLATREVLLSIDGRDVKDIYAVGVGGCILHFDGQRWDSLQSPTNLGLMRVRCYAQTNYICGYHGLLMRGGLNGWKILNHEHKAAPFLDMQMFKNSLYVCSEFGLFKLDGDALVQLLPPFEGEMGYGSLAVANDRLISVGGETVLLYDGENWSRISCPWNAET